MPERLRTCTDAELDEAIAWLARRGNAQPAEGWAMAGPDAPGLYSWWVDAAGAADLSDGLGETVEPGLIYAGQTGATKWPSGTVGAMTLRKRISGNHLRGRTRGSTFRWTLACALKGALDLTVVDRRTISPESETQLSAWMRAHLAVATFAFEDRDRLGDLENRLLQRLDPPLNLEGMPASRIRAALSAARRWSPPLS